ncbi:hypothetical protein ACTMTJ_39055 [Phytohabitans sp. LJ34]|uniref:hypothetical protein n=1 Tax=Phytohabitans sp. LJ34 TaxID=3452217 RepID=UPI003F8A1204
MDEAASSRHLAEALDDLVADGTIAAQPMAPLAHLLSGAMNEAALWLATTKRSNALEQTCRHSPAYWPAPAPTDRKRVATSKRTLTTKRAHSGQCR